MRIGLLTDLDGQRVWHGWLASALAEHGHTFVVLRPGTDAVVPLAASLQLALWLDPILFKLKGEHAFDACRQQKIADEQAGQKFSEQPFDVLIDASASAQSAHEAHKRIRLLFNDQPSELAAVNAVLESRNVVLSLVDASAAVIETARPGIERPECLTCGLDNVFSAVVELLVERIAVPRHCEQKAVQTSAQSASPSARTGTRYLAQTLSTRVANKVSSYLDRSTRVRSSWGVAVRLCADGEGLLDGPWPRTAAFDLVPDDGLRYYADPFVFSHNGRSHVFIEEYPLATARGVISVAELDERGRTGAFRPVLECGYHLSYPFVFSYDNQIWMIPEACASGVVDLYRAINYPDQWALDRRLLDDVPGCDATIVSYGGKYFMILTATRWLGTTWDKQRMFYAQTPLGPWTEMDGGLVRIDCMTARPAGAPVYIGGRILRPVQDCSRGYGSSMGVLEVQTLAPTVCSEVLVARMTARAKDNEIFTHTYSRNGKFEVVDVCGVFGAAQQISVTCAPAAR